MVRGLTQTRGLIRGERRDIQNPAAVVDEFLPTGRALRRAVAPALIRCRSMRPSQVQLLSSLLPIYLRSAHAIEGRDAAPSHRTTFRSSTKTA